jgi:hypothetical protein
MRMGDECLRVVEGARAVWSVARCGSHRNLICKKSELMPKQIDSIGRVLHRCILLDVTRCYKHPVTMIHYSIIPADPASQSDKTYSKIQKPVCPPSV